MRIKVCSQCNKEFKRNQRFSEKQWKSTRFCSLQCFGNSRKGRKEEIIECNNCKKELKVFCYKKQKYCSHGCFSKWLAIHQIGRINSEETRKRISDKVKGRYAEKSSNWKGGITPKNHRLRNSPEYEKWRLSVFKRDWFRCLDCGEKKNNIEADHIYRFVDYPRLRFEILNGQTLCKECHKQKTIFERTGIYIIPNR